MKRTIMHLTLALALVACGDLKPDGEPELDTSNPIAIMDATFAADAGGDSALPPPPPVEQKRELDTSSSEVWLYLDLETGETRTDATSWASWDIKGQRFKLGTNGGASGPGGVKVSVVTDSTFAAVTKAPIGGYASDPSDGSDTDTEPDYVISNGDLGWYEYNVMTHALAPRAHVYVVRTQEGGFFKLAVEGYYNSAGSSGYLQLRWAPISAPDGPIQDRAPTWTGDGGVDGMTGASTP